MFEKEVLNVGDLVTAGWIAAIGGVTWCVKKLLGMNSRLVSMELRADAGSREWLEFKKQYRDDHAEMHAKVAHVQEDLSAIKVNGKNNSDRLERILDMMNMAIVKENNDSQR